MKATLRTLGGLERGLIVANQAVVVIMMMAMTGLVFANVVSRYLFGDSLNWSEEIARYLMVWVTYIGAGLAMREGQHVAIDYVQTLLPRRLQPWVRGVVAASILAFLGILTYVGIEFSAFAWRQTTPVMQWPMGSMYLAIPVGALLFALHFLAIARQWIMATPGFEEPEDVHSSDGVAGPEAAE